MYEDTNKAYPRTAPKLPPHPPNPPQSVNSLERGMGTVGGTGKWYGRVVPVPLSGTLCWECWYIVPPTVPPTAPGQTSTHPCTPSPYQKNTLVLNTYCIWTKTMTIHFCHLSVTLFIMWHSNALLLVDSVILLASHISRSDLIHHGSKSEIKSSLPNHLLELRPALRCFLQSLDKYVDK